MADYRKLKEMLHGELERIADRDELNTQSLEMVDKIAHSLKCLATVEAMDGYSEDYPERGSYARGGRRRDSMGRYASDYHDWRY